MNEELLKDMKRFDNKWGNVDTQLAIATYPLNQVGVKKVLEHINNLESKIESLEEDVEYWKEKYKELENSLNNDYDPEIEIPQIHGEGISIERSEI